MDSNSAPRPDGYSSIFYKSCWNIIATSLLVVVHHFFKTSKIPTSVNSTIVFYPKKKILFSPRTPQLVFVVFY